MEFLLPPKRCVHSWRSLGVLLFIVVFTLGIVLYLPAKPPLSEQSFWLWLGGLLFLAAAGIAVLLILLMFREGLKSLTITGERLEQCNELLNRQRTLLMQIAQGVRLTDAAKEIVFKDAERLELGEAVLGKLHQHDFEAAETMIDAMKEFPRYRPLYEQLSRMAERYRASTEEGRITQVINHIEGLLDRQLWSQAAIQIENLQSMFPYSEKARNMSARFQEKKNLHKRKLLAEWDRAVKGKNTDRCLDILKELDMYLTPSEALALQESASTVFKTKLHNLGVEFSVAVTEKNWSHALTCAREIVQNFPNSRMAAEIRSKMDILQERAESLKMAKTS
jgi:hypothetical protein